MTNNEEIKRTWKYLDRRLENIIDEYITLLGTVKLGVTFKNILKEYEQGKIRK